MLGSGSRPEYRAGGCKRLPSRAWCGADPAGESLVLNHVKDEFYVPTEAALAGAGVGGLGDGIMGIAAFVMAGGTAGGIAGVGGLREERIVGPVVGSEPGGSVQDDAQAGNGREGVDAN